MGFKTKFDFIHVRSMAVAIRDWPRFARQIFNQTLPGGFVEIVDNDLRSVVCDDGTGGPDSPVSVYMKIMCDSMKASGLNPDLDSAFVEKILKDAGFVDVKVTTVKMPMGAWPKDKKYKRAGRIAAEVLNTGFEAYGLATVGWPDFPLLVVITDMGHSWLRRVLRLMLRRSSVMMGGTLSIRERNIGII